MCGCSDTAGAVRAWKRLVHGIQHTKRDVLGGGQGGDELLSKGGDQGRDVVSIQDLRWLLLVRLGSCVARLLAGWVVKDDSVCVSVQGGTARGLCCIRGRQALGPLHLSLDVVAATAVVQACGTCIVCYGIGAVDGADAQAMVGDV